MPGVADAEGDDHAGGVRVVPGGPGSDVAGMLELAIARLQPHPRHVHARGLVEVVVTVEGGQVPAFGLAHRGPVETGLRQRVAPGPR